MHPSFFIILFTWLLFSSFDQEQVLKVFEKIEVKERELRQDIQTLRKLLDLEASASGLSLLKASQDMKKELQEKIASGTQSFEKGEYSEAKRFFREAWEMGPDEAINQHNLGLAYQKLGNEALAKKMLKAAMEKHPQHPQKKLIQDYLIGKVAKEAHTQENPLANEIKNLEKEAYSYAKSTLLETPAKAKETIKTLLIMEDKIQGDETLQKKHFLDMADLYASFSWYDKAYSLYQAYERSMKGQELPDDYHPRLLQIEEKYKQQKQQLRSYEGFEKQPKIYRKLKKDLEELKIFASQLDEFVQQPSNEDTDFMKISHRLKEFRWGNFPNRHVIVANRYQEVLFSSLPGTLPLERYQDKKGRQFLKDITHMAESLDLNEADFFVVELKVGKEFVPYSILYTYVPKHELFIMVRIPLLNTV